ncbi:DUF3999 domain-containing protein [Enterobacillus tribolii]|nr:DUF3999 domain-containing protein [Enterobacillus tribolii]
MLSWQMREKMRIKLNNWLLSGVLCLSAAAWAETVDAPSDFAYGIPLTTDSTSPFFRVDLPREVYTQTAWPDMRDVRVFNSQGMTVPFALFSAVATVESNTSYPLRLFPMRGHKSEERNRPVVSLKSASGIEVTLPVEEEQSVGRNFLLEVEEVEGGYPALNALKLEWTRLPENWQARVSVLYSSDLKRWNTLVSDAPLMDLTSGADRLLLDKIDLRDRGYRPNARYFMLTFRDDSAPAALDIRAAQGVVELKDAEPRRITLASQSKSVSAGEAEYVWSSPQPLNQLVVVPAQNNTVLPLEIEYRSSATESWRPLSKQVVYRLNGRHSAPIALHGQLVQGVRLKGVNQQWNENLPQVSGERDVRSLVFNAQGSAPFLLAWGNKAAGEQAIDIQALIPEELHQSLSVDSLPDAGLQSVQELGGEARLHATSAVEQAGMWQKGILWAVLILGAGGLVLLALKVWREVQKREE